MAELDAGHSAVSAERVCPADPIWPRWLVGVLATFAVLAGIYSAATPIFEPPDEVFHFPLIDHIARTGALPVQDADVETRWHQEGSQPPLYYLLSAPLILPIDRSDLAARLERNPHARIGVGLATDNHVTVLHDWHAEAFPWRRTALAVHVVRCFGIVLGLGTVVAIYHIARLAAPGQRPVHVTATLLAAFNPMFLFITASVNNDNLINLLSAGGLALTLGVWRSDLTRRRLAPLAVVLALASLTKLSGLALYPVAAAAIALVHRRNRRPLRHLLGAGLVLAGTWALVAGWWYARNWHLYGDPTGLNRMIAIIGPREHAPTWGELLDEFEGFRLSFWGVFGTLNVIAPDALFNYGDALSLLALAGLVVGAIRFARGRRSPAAQPLTLLALHVLIVLAALVNWTRRTPATQGRLLFPALGPLAVLAAIGLAALIPRAAWRRWLPLAAVPLVIAAAVLPFHTIWPTYRPPPTVPALPADALPLNARFGPIELLGVKISDKAAVPGSEKRGLTVTLYWRPDAHTPDDMSFYVQAFGLPDENASRGLQEIGKIDSYPGRGLLRTTTWDLGAIYADTYHLPIAENARTPVRPRLKIGWRQFETSAELEPLQPDGTPRGPVMVDGGRVPGQTQTLAGGVGPAAVFGGALRLNRSAVLPATLAPGGTLTVALEWEALARASEDFTILVHLIDPASPGQPVAQGDAPPLDGRWPTSAWEPGVPFVDTHRVALGADVPPGSYRVAVGFYRPADFSRLPVETKSDTLPGAVILPHIVTVEGP